MGQAEDVSWNTETVLVRRSQKGALLDRLTKYWYRTTKFIVEIDIFMPEGMARCFIIFHRCNRIL
jgi:hypothetical protein